MIRFLTDEDFDGRIVRGLRRHLPEIDLIRCQEIGLRTVDDRVLLEHAAKGDRVLLSRDFRTMIPFALERVAKGLPMPGVIIVSQDFPIRTAIEELEFIAQCGEPEDFIDKVRRLPL
jgi:hypothetical protein